jgi:hypothetical protein
MEDSTNRMDNPIMEIFFIFYNLLLDNLPIKI